MDWSAFLSRQVKDLTVGHQILITTLTTIFTYILIFSINWIMIREGRRKDMIARSAEALKTIAVRRDDVFGEILERLGEARVELGRLLSRRGVAEIGGAEVATTLGFETVFAKVDEAVASSSKLRSITIVQSYPFSSMRFDNQLVDRYYTLLEEMALKGAMKDRDRLQHLLAIVLSLTEEVQEAADFEGELARIQFVFMKLGRLRRGEANYCRSLESRLHGKTAWPPLNWWDYYVRRNYTKGIPQVQTEWESELKHQKFEDSLEK